MADIKNSQVLEQIIQYAKTYDDAENVHITLERYMLAVIDVIEGKFIPEGWAASGNSALREILGDNLDYENAKDFLLNHIRQKKDRAMQDSLKMLRQMDKIRSQAETDGVEEITPEYLLKNIVQAPTQTIAECLKCRIGAEVQKIQDVEDVEASEQSAAADMENFMAKNPIEDITLVYKYLIGILTEEEEAVVERSERLQPIFSEFISLGTKHSKEFCMHFLRSRITLFPEPTAASPELHNTSDSGNNTPDKPQNSGDERKKMILELTEKAKNVRQALLEKVMGQEKAVNTFAAGYFQSQLLAMSDPEHKRPATFLFAGPPGVGKTFLAETAADILKLPFARFDMSEYCDNESATEFCGSDSVYKNGKQGNFTSFVTQNPQCIVLLDEIEKAHISIIHLFLQILDAGRIRDNHDDKEISLKDAILIFTTNAGKPFYENVEQGDLSSVSRKVILKALQNDVDPKTGIPYFPAAICSRFASGNVVMFNYITAHNLFNIAKREVLRHADNFQRQFGIKVEIDERVFASLLFAEGSGADARNIRSRAETFFDDEVFELFRLLGTRDDADLMSFEKIRIDVNVSSASPDICGLFEETYQPEILVFASKNIMEKCENSGAKCVFLYEDETDKAIECLRNHDIRAILIDMELGAQKGFGEFLNAEDIISESRSFMSKCRQLYADIPMYLLESDSRPYHQEERVSFNAQGVRGFLSPDHPAAFAADLEQLCMIICQQNHMLQLARNSKIVTYKTAQRILPEEKAAEIQLYDFEMVTAMDAEDSKNIVSDVSKPNVRFEDVIGAEEAKEELRYFVEYLKNPKKYRGTGVRAPKGVLLYGPPGTGKTMLAKAMACESDVTYISAEGNQFLKKFVGEGPEKVHELFRLAKKYAPTILFVDEIDSIARERTGTDSAGVEAILNAFLAEMDGFSNDAAKPVFVLAATNYDVEPGGRRSLDPALMRRFDRRVYIDLPDQEARIRFMRKKLSENHAFEISDEKINNLALRSVGMSLASLDSVFEMSLRSAIRNGGVKVTDDVLEEAFETFNNGEKREWSLSLLERVARHETGHALVHWMNGGKPAYVTVAARGDHGGYMLRSVDEDKKLSTREELLADIRTSLAGRAAEIVYYGEENGISTGASGDLQNATRIAEYMICYYGMDESIGLAFVDRENLMSGPLGMEIRERVNAILKEELTKAIAVIAENRHIIDRTVKLLIEKTHLSEKEILKVFTENN